MQFKISLGQSLEMERKKEISACKFTAVYCWLLSGEHEEFLKELNAVDSQLQLGDIFSTCLLKF